MRHTVSTRLEQGRMSWKTWLAGAAAITALMTVSAPSSAAGLGADGDWNFGSASASIMQNQVSMEQLRQQKLGGQFNQPVTNLQVDTQSSTAIGNLNQITATNSPGATVTSGQTNQHSPQSSGITTTGDLNGTLKVQPLNGQ